MEDIIQVKPLKQRIFIETINEGQSSGGIIIPTNSSGEKTSIGKVISIGKKVDEIFTGDTVLFAKEKGNTVDISGKKYLILDQEDVLAIFVKNSDKHYGI